MIKIQQACCFVASISVFDTAVIGVCKVWHGILFMDSNMLLHHNKKASYESEKCATYRRRRGL
ncbi:MAG TPA: hypothetical protein PLM90_07085, partial [Chitinophagales bacterium]|nr:hypothetical protein [Chitinophagales bacterium]